MINDTFYPSTDEVILKIKHKIDWDNVYNLLEPSAGDGTLLTGLISSGPVTYHSTYRNVDKNDTLCKVSHAKMAINYFAIEIEPSLQAVVSNIKLVDGCGDYPNPVRLIGSDFLTYNGYYDFDTIVMNPPFDKGAEHLLKAWDVIRNGTIYCVLNAETVNNPFSKTRKQLKTIIDKHGVVDNLGQPFKIGAVRSTAVSCVLVTLKKSSDPFVNCNFDKMDKLNNKGFTVSFEDEKFVVSRDEIKSRVQLHVNKIGLYKNCLQSIATFRQYGGTDDFTSIKNYETSYNEYIERSTREAWQKLIALPVFHRLMSRDVKDEFMRQITNVSCLEFTEDNISRYLDTLVHSYSEIMTRAISDIFDSLTKYDKSNISGAETWWTNDSHRVNKKVIIPNVMEAKYSSTYNVEYKIANFLDDIDKVMMYLSGVRLVDLNYQPGMDLCASYVDGIVDNLKENKNNPGKWFKSKFFLCKWYKKGTLHLEFIDETVWQEFNMRAAGHKNWIPDDIKARRKDKIKNGMLIEYKKD